VRRESGVCAYWGKLRWKARAFSASSRLITLSCMSSVLGMQFMIDDLRKHSGMVKIVETVLYDFQDVDDDGDREEVLGLSFLKLDFEAMKFETEKTGKKEFEVETAAGISGRYCVKVEMYEPTLIYHCEPMN